MASNNYLLMYYNYREGVFLANFGLCMYIVVMPYKCVNIIILTVLVL